MKKTWKLFRESTFIDDWMVGAFIAAAAFEIALGPHNWITVLFVGTVLCVFVKILVTFLKVVFDAHLTFYYRFWLQHLKPRRNLSFEERQVVDSFYHKLPQLVRRQDLMEKRFWPNWVFAVLVLFRPGSVGQEVYTLSDRKRWKLTVDLTGQSYGIYSNCGKNYLRKRFLPDNPAATTAIMDSSVEIQRFLSPQTNAGQILPWGLGIGTGPLRWASGGFLPIVQHKGAYWVLFFFRDRFPVGLNLPNGASETKDEYKNIHLLMAREFSEEVIVLSANPFRGATLAQPVFVDADAFVDFHNAQFAKVHANLRQASDSLRINIDGGFLREVDTVRTPFETEVRFHGPDMQNPETRTTRNILYTINPFELGIELIRICTFTLESNEYIIDGEYDLSREILIRRIPVLIRLSYLNKLFHDNGSSLGERVSDGDSADGKLLKGIPVEHCKIFSYDIAARHDRLQDITNMLNDNPGAKTRENLEWEREEIINQWLANYEEIFMTAMEEGFKGDSLHRQQARTLCPVSWKTLEIAFAHGLFEDLLRKEEAEARSATASGSSG